MDIEEALYYASVLLAVIGILLVLWFAVSQAFHIMRQIVNETSPLVVYVDQAGNVIIKPVT